VSHGKQIGRYVIAGKAMALVSDVAQSWCEVKITVVCIANISAWALNLLAEHFGSSLTTLGTNIVLYGTRFLWSQNSLGSANLITAW
jgi:hypothetical protein